MLKLKLISAFFFLIFFPVDVQAKCREFDIHPPAFCAKVVIQDMVKVEGGSCVFRAKISDLTETIPAYASFPWTRKNIYESDVHLVSAEGFQCKDSTPNAELRGVVVKRCNDNRSLIYFLPLKIRTLFGLEAIYPDLDFGVVQFVSLDAGQHRASNKPDENSKKLECHH